MMRRFQIFCLIAVLASGLQASNKSVQVVEGIGDMLQFLPAIAAIYALHIKDYEGLKELAIGVGSTLGTVIISKQALHAISKKDPNLVRFAERPNHSNFEGFPSGHTASAFSAVGFLQKRYGWKFGLPTAILATFVGYSRIYARKHTPFQVVAGAMLGFGVSYLVASKYIDPTKHNLSMDTQTDIRGRSQYSIRYSHFF
ncbi:phosphatase PAP2 family protein [Helicobacter pametensis]|uniref:phosphatase PAP2 family protein n=1 Tax=Helicobacter pametensis TaxID=95149 RepID=UPI0004AEE052|nr:phosphatase PAP2 family protein [Helicobacter pametensis]